MDGKGREAHIIFLTTTGGHPWGAEHRKGGCHPAGAAHAFPEAKFACYTAGILLLFLARFCLSANSWGSVDMTVFLPMSVYTPRTLRLVSSIMFPFIRSNRIEFYFSVPAATTPGAPLTRKRGKLAGQPTGPAGLLTIRHAHSPYTAPKRHYGNGWTET